MRNPVAVGWRVKGPTAGTVLLKAAAERLPVSLGVPKGDDAGDLGLADAQEYLSAVV
jgi:hypothetical protein